MAIIGFLASLAFGSLVAARRKSEDARTLADVQQIKLAMELYEQENGGYPNPQEPSSPNLAQAGASIYCVGRSTCTHRGIPRNGVAPLYIAYFKDVLEHYSPLLAATFNAFPKYLNAGDQVKYTYKNVSTGSDEISEGVVFSCSKLSDQTRPRVLGTLCPEDQDVFIEYGSHKEGGIKTYVFRLGSTNLATAGTTNPDCPDLGHGSRNCETDYSPIPPTDPIYDPVESDASPGAATTPVTQYTVTATVNGSTCAATPASQLVNNGGYGAINSTVNPGTYVHIYDGYGTPNVFYAGVRSSNSTYLAGPITAARPVLFYCYGQSSEPVHNVFVGGQNPSGIEAIPGGATPNLAVNNGKTSFHVQSRINEMPPYTMCPSKISLVSIDGVAFNISTENTSSLGRIYNIVKHPSHPNIIRDLDVDIDFRIGLRTLEIGYTMGTYSGGICS